MHNVCLAGMRPPNLDVSHMGASAPQSVHSMGSGLSRSGSFAPSTLSVLYENQAMKMEREELKSELKLISARVRFPYLMMSMKDGNVEQGQLSCNPCYGMSL